MTTLRQILAFAMEKLRRGFVYFAVLRPSFIFAAMIIYLPLTASSEAVPGNAMLANLFVEYDFWKGFWFGFALSGAVWALMLTACITLDIARDRERSSAIPWLPDPGEQKRRVTIPITSRWTFFFFSSLAVPALVVVLLNAESRVGAGAGLFLGGLLSFVYMNLVATLVHTDNAKYQVFPWQPFGFRLKGTTRVLRTVFSRGMELVLPPDDIFEDSASGRRMLKEDHFYAALSVFFVTIIYAAIYWLFKPSFWVHWPLEDLPPAGFIYALLLPLIWIVSALWVYLYRYRFALYLSVGLTFFLTFLATRPFVETRLGSPAHTYDVLPGKNVKSLEPKTVLEQLANREHGNLIIVAASGGGILAAGWTAQVLTSLHAAYPPFAKELRLISSVSGGSVGAAHYVNSLLQIAKLNQSEQRAALKAIANDAMRSSLASTAYGVAFPDFKRAIWPFWVDQEFDRARLLEADWRRISNCRQQAIKHSTDAQDFRAFCRQRSEAEQSKRVIFSEWRDQIANGERPAVIFNATVLETGERVAITPISTLKSKWSGLTLKNGQPYPLRHSYARTLNEYLAAEDEDSDPGKADQGERKNNTCNGSGYEHGYDIDLWTAARLSATFSYVSPAARAVCFDPIKGERLPPNPDSTGRLHLIDGGYHDNYGVASALNWIAAALDEYDTDRLPVSRIALIEIRAKPDIPKSTARTEWSAAWLGPFWGLLSSWGYAQTSANDTSVSELIARFKDRSTKTSDNIQFESFVFVPEWSGPLSWHLSTDQKKRLCEAWSSSMNQTTLQNLLAFLHGDNAQYMTASAPVDSSPEKDRCDRFD